MRRFRYNEQGPDDEPRLVEVTDEDIRRDFYAWWSTQMLKVGKAEEITFEHCVQDFLTVHWGWEVDENKN